MTWRWQEWPPRGRTALPRESSPKVTVEPSDRPSLHRGRLERVHLPTLLGRFREHRVWAAFIFINGFVSIALLSFLAMLTGTPFVFPSLGPTAMLFFLTPGSRSATPRNAILGHAIGILCGYAALGLTGLQDAPSAMIMGVDGARVLAAALSLAATGALMVLLKVPHAPAGATTLIISLGVITGPLHLLEIELAVGVLAIQAIVINRLAGIAYPLWNGSGRGLLLNGWEVVKVREVVLSEVAGASETDEP